MIYYFAAFLLTLIFTLFSLKFAKTSPRLKKLFIILSILPFSFVAGFRADHIGIDTSLNYLPTYRQLASPNSDPATIISQKYTSGFGHLMFFFSRFTLDPTPFLLFVAILTNALIILAIHRQSKHPLLSLTLYFLSGAFFLSLNGMRQFFSLSLVLFSLSFFQTGRPLAFLFFVLLASSIHSTSILFLLLLPLRLFKLTPNRVLIIFTTLAFLMPFSLQLLSLLLKHTSFINYFSAGKGFFVDPVYTSFFLNLLWLFWALLLYSRYGQDQTFQLYFKLQFLATLTSLYTFILPQGYRLQQIFDFFQILSLPYLYFLSISVRPSARRLLFLGLLLIFSGYFTKCFVLSDDNQIHHYSPTLVRRLS